MESKSCRKLRVAVIVFDSEGSIPAGNQPFVRIPGSRILGFWNFFVWSLYAQKIVSGYHQQQWDVTIRCKK